MDIADELKKVYLDGVESGITAERARWAAALEALDLKVRSEEYSGIVGAAVMTCKAELKDFIKQAKRTSG